MQTIITERLVYDKPKKLPTLKDVVSEIPCFSCVKSVAPSCDVVGCDKLTAWLMEAQQ